MKTAISIDTMVYQEAEKAAAEFSSDDITERLNQYYGDHKTVLDDMIKQAAYTLFAQEDW